MRPLTLALLAIFIAGAGCTGSGDEETVASFPASVAPDALCRNNAVAVGDDGRWRLTEDLPLSWQGRERVEGAIEQTGSGDLFFAAEDVRLAASTELTAPSPCVPWQDPQPRGEDS